VAEMQQLYNRGIRNFWFTDAQFIPPVNINDAVELLQLILDAGMKDIHWAAYIQTEQPDARNYAGQDWDELL